MQNTVYKAVCVRHGRVTLRDFLAIFSNSCSVAGLGRVSGGGMVADPPDSLNGLPVHLLHAPHTDQVV